jgi:ribokinase
MRDLTIAVLGSVLADITVRTARLPHSGENLYVEEVATSPGGKGSNAAVTLARHGATVHLISNVGADAAGEQIRAALAAEGVGVAGLGGDPEIATGAVVMLAEASGETCYLVFPGASRTLTEADVAGRLAPHLGELDAIYLNLEAPEAALLAAAEIARRQALPLYIDAGPERPMPPALWAHAALLSPNAAEAGTHTGIAVTDLDSAERAARALLAQGPALVAVKLGAQGVLLVDHSGSTHVPAFSVSVVDPAGAGDAFTAGLTWALLQGETLVAAARYGNACGAWATTRLGTVPAMPSQAEVAAFLAVQPPLSAHP